MAEVVLARGCPLPIGVTYLDGGVNFSIYSRHATRMWLLIFDDLASLKPRFCFELDPTNHRTGDLWHVLVKGLTSEMGYLLQADGPFAPHEGHRFNPRRALLDPAARALANVDHWDFGIHCDPDPWHTAVSIPNEQYRVKCLLPPTEEFDWGDDEPPNIPWTETVIYETHVRGLTIHPSSQVHFPGTYLGLVEKIPYLKELGITAVELLPVQQFNPYDIDRINPLTGERLKNYWGYNTVAFYAPHAQYSMAYLRRGDPRGALSEFKAMVKELHRAGMEVILDVVFNHTAEGNEFGPMLNFKGLDNLTYYILDDDDKSRYKNFSGCGNTFNCNHPVVREFILQCLRFWVIEMHVDGFRFDLASILGRDPQGRLIPNPPLLETIAEDPILRRVKLIAEAWDAAGAYQVGFFPGERWSEWNGCYRDDVRRFWRGDRGMLGPFATRICGSADLYQQSGKRPTNSINFITCHDGFTLNDLVSYEHKHNEANGEDNRDGTNENYSCNYGVEGPTDDPAIEAIRLRQIKNFFVTLFVSRGVPMILGGDEFRRTQLGNNNAYCQDNEISWFNWELAEKNRSLLRFVQKLIRFRKRHWSLRKDVFYEPHEVEWFGPGGSPPDWADGLSLGMRIYPERPNEPHLCLLFNADSQPVTMPLPPPPVGKQWRIAIDTAAGSPRDIFEEGEEPLYPNPRQAFLLGRHTLILVAR